MLVGAVKAEGTEVIRSAHREDLRALQIVFLVVIHFPHGAEKSRAIGILIADTVVVIVFRPFLFVAVLTHAVGIHEVNG